MHESKLKDLISQLKLSSDKYFYEYLYEYLDFYGEENKHLKNVYNDGSPGRGNHREEDNLLTGEEIVYGDLLLYSSHGHDSAEYFQNINNLEQAENKIVNMGGIFNSFVSNIQVFQNGKIKPYEIYIKDGESNKFVFEKHSDDDLFMSLLQKGFKVYFRWLD